MERSSAGLPRPGVTTAAAGSPDSGTSGGVRLRPHHVSPAEPAHHVSPAEPARFAARGAGQLGRRSGRPWLPLESPLMSLMRWPMLVATPRPRLLLELEGRF
jgi:hypothetical protein